MKLKAKEGNYEHKGLIYTDAVFKDVERRINIEQEQMIIVFQMFYGDNIPSEFKAVLVINKDTDQTAILEDSDGEEQGLGGLNGSNLSDYTVVNWGFPEFKDTGMFFTFDDITEELIVPDGNLKEFTEGWFLNNLSLNDEKIKEQFKF